METLEDNIRNRAHQLWDNDGRPHGRHIEYWLMAERELKTPTNEGPINEGLVDAGESHVAAARKQNGASKKVATPHAKTRSAKSPRAGKALSAAAAAGAATATMRHK